MADAEKSLAICVINDGSGPVDIFGKTELTNEECAELASAFPFNYNSIRSAFRVREGR